MRGYERFAPADELSARWQALRALAQGGGSDVDYYLEVSRLLATIRCDHTIAEPPAALSAWREEHPSYLPLHLEFFGDRAFVVVADPEQPALRRGQELLSVDGRSVAEIAAAVRPLISIDGHTEHVKDAVLGFSSEYEGGAFDHFSQLLFGFKASYALVLRGSDDKEHRATVRALTYPRWLEDVVDGNRYRNFSEEVAFRFLADGSGYLNVPTFVNYRQPVDPDEVFGKIFRRLRKAGTARLIIDLRENGGGSTEPALSLLRYLMVEPFVWAKPSRIKTLDIADLRPYLSTWEESALQPDPNDFVEKDGWFELKAEQERKPIVPHRDRFAGEVLLLVGPANSSGSTHLIAKLKDAGRVTLVGGPTGGSPTGATAGVIFFMKLPHSGISVKIPVIRTVLNVTSFASGQAIQPDLPVALTPEALFAGEDLALAAALDAGR